MTKRPKKVDPDDELHQLRNAFVKRLATETPKVQVHMVVMALMQVLSRVGNSEEALNEMLELTELAKIVEALNMQSTSEH
jgi:hypothetical protein